MPDKIKMNELKGKFDNKENFTLIEVLEPGAFQEMHIKGAINIPLSKIGKEAKDRFDKDKELIVYCTDYECTASPTAAQKLEDLGFTNVKDYEGGKKEWAGAGLPVEKGET